MLKKITIILVLFLVLLAGCVQEPAPYQRPTKDSNLAFKGEPVQISKDECMIDMQCDDKDPSTLDVCRGTPTKCENIKITVCVSGDNYCPPNCTRDKDLDCPILDECQTDEDCEDGDIYTEDYCFGSPKKCVHKQLSRCSGGDGLCPSGCGYPEDSDCDECNSSSDCDDGNQATTDVCYGAPKRCKNVVVRLDICITGDNYCPPGCSSDDDEDCEDEDAEYDYTSSEESYVENYFTYLDFIWGADKKTVSTLRNIIKDKMRASNSKYKAFFIGETGVSEDEQNIAKQIIEAIDSVREIKDFGIETDMDLYKLSSTLNNLDIDTNIITGKNDANFCDIIQPRVEQIVADQNNDWSYVGYTSIPHTTSSASLYAYEWGGQPISGDTLKECIDSANVDTIAVIIASDDAVVPRTEIKFLESLKNKEINDAERLVNLFNDMWYDKFRKRSTSEAMIDTLANDVFLVIKTKSKFRNPLIVQAFKYLLRDIEVREAIEQYNYFSLGVEVEYDGMDELGEFDPDEITFTFKRSDDDYIEIDVDADTGKVTGKMKINGETTNFT